MAASNLGRPVSARFRISGIPIFTYHGVCAASSIRARGREASYWIGRDAFENQLGCIRRLGYRSTLLDRLCFSQEVSSNDELQVVLTFDDGLASAYELIFPLLQEYGFHGVFFLNTAMIGKAGFLSWREIRLMQRDGHSFQSHSHQHVYLPWLPKSELAYQVGISKWMIEDSLGTRVDFLSAPFGEVNQRVVDTAQKQGYRAVCNSWSWPARTGTATINRVCVERSTTLGTFQNLLRGRPVAYWVRAASWAVRYIPKKLLLRFLPSSAPVETNSSENDYEISATHSPFCSD